MNKIALILSGCGQHDGSEIQETTLTLLALEQNHIKWEAFAPNIPQVQVIDHSNNKNMQETRNVLVESARLVRGKIRDLKQADVDNYDAIIIPGGLGVVTNLCDYYTKGVDFTLQDDFKKFISKASKTKIPTAFICIAPVMIPKIYSNSPRMTIGNDVKIADQMRSLGAVHIDCIAEEVVKDHENKIISTPANMVAKNIKQVYQGISKLISSLVGFI